MGKEYLKNLTNIRSCFMENIEKKGELLFEIPDYVYISRLVSYMPMFIIIFILGIIEVIRGNPYNLHVNLMIGISLSILISLYIKIKKSFNNEKRRIKFFNNRIVKTSNNKSIFIRDIEEIICFSNLFASPTLEGINPKLRLQNNKKISKLLYLPLLSIIIVFFTIPLVLLNLFIYRQFILTSQLTILRWEDSESIPIIYPLPNKKEKAKVENYFNEFLKMDINKIEKNYI